MSRSPGHAEGKRTALFVHADWFHLAGNMLFLWLFGSLIEDVLRPWGLAALYLAGGAAATLLHILITRGMGGSVDVPLVGASGAIAAIMGLFVLRFYKTRVEVFYWIGYFRMGTFWVQSMWALAVYVGIEILEAVLDAGSGGGVAHWAHIGGFFVGMGVAPFLGTLAAARQEYVTDDPEANVENVRRVDEAAAAERALRADPTNAYRMRQLAQAYRTAGEYERATQVYERCIQSFASRNMLDQASAAYQELLETNASPGLPPEVLVKVARQLEAEQPREAVDAYRFLVERYPTRPETETALLRLATLHHRPLSQPFEAARWLDEFLRRFPNSEWAGQARQARSQLEQQYRLG